jgi:hypothetical protein
LGIKDYFGFVILIAPRSSPRILCLAAGMGAYSLPEWNSEGFYTKRLQAGYPGMYGIIGARMGQKGFNGPEKIYQGVVTLLRAYRDWARFEMDKLGIGREAGICNFQYQSLPLPPLFGRTH